MNKRDVCVFTIVQNDEWMINRWHEYYSQHFCPKDIYILDHHLRGKGCADHLGHKCNVLPLTYGLSFDHDWLRVTVTVKQKQLLESYNKVLFCEADEFVIPDPNKYSGLIQYIKGFRGSIMKTVGYNITHASGEPDMDLSGKILEQRSQWIRSFSFDKPLLATVPVEYTVGFHNCVNNSEQDGDLYLIHLKWMCRRYLLEKNTEICKREWSEFDWRSGRGLEHKAIDQEAIEKLYLQLGKPELIPERFRGLL